MHNLKHRLLISLLAGGLLSLPMSANAACQPNTPQLIIYHAGSLTADFSAVEDLFTQLTGICVTDVAAGSVDAARRVTTGQEPCDIFASADFKVIDLLLKPAGFADYDILFGQGGMVLVYTTNSKNAATITAAGSVFNPPASVPRVADDWYTQLLQPGVAIAGYHPFLDPSGYRADLIFQLVAAGALASALLPTLTVLIAEDRREQCAEGQARREQSARSTRAQACHHREHLQSEEADG